MIRRRPPERDRPNRSAVSDLRRRQLDSPRGPCPTYISRPRMLGTTLTRLLGRDGRRRIILTASAPQNGKALPHDPDPNRVVAPPACDLTGVRRFGAKPDKKICRRSSGEPEFMEDAPHGRLDGIVVEIDRFWVARAKKSPRNRSCRRYTSGSGSRHRSSIALGISRRDTGRDVHGSG
jgi:hypothetical protein